jgi:hypothetical protein
MYEEHIAFYMLISLMLPCFAWEELDSIMQFDNWYSSMKLASFAILLLRFSAASAPLDPC